MAITAGMILGSTAIGVTDHIGRRVGDGMIPGTMATMAMPDGIIRGAILGITGITDIDGAILIIMVGDGIILIIPADMWFNAVSQAPVITRTA